MKAFNRWVRSHPSLYKALLPAYRCMGALKYRTWQLSNARLVLPEFERNDVDVFNAFIARPDAEETIAELTGFTGLSREEILRRLSRREAHFKTEFNWHRPQNRQQLAWFYRCSYGYLYANCLHGYWERLNWLKLTGGRVLDYGAGIGNNVIHLAQRGFQVDYFEISIIQESFARSRAAKRKLDNVRFLSPYVDGHFDPIHSVQGPYDVIVLQDVLEHVPDYHILVGHLIQQLRPGGFIFENTPFATHEEKTKEIDIHLMPTIPIAEAMKGMRPLEREIWQKVD